MYIYIFKPEHNYEPHIYRGPWLAELIREDKSELN